MIPPISGRKNFLIFYLHGVPFFCKTEIVPGKEQYTADIFFRKKITVCKKVYNIIQFKLLNRRI